MKYTLITAAAALAALTACDTAVTSNKTQADYNAAVLAGKQASLLPVTPVNALPVGSANYSGNVHSSVTIDGDAGYDILGDMNMRVNFDGARAVTGTVTNVNLFDRFKNGEANQTMTGALSISGNTALGDIVGNAQGRLGAVLPNVVVEQTSDVNLTLDGNVRSSVADGDTVYGTVTGGGKGEFDMILTGNGRFSGTR